jgi:hypothetical protein
MMTFSIAAGILLLTLAVSFYNRQKLRRQRQEKVAQGIAQLTLLLELIRDMQRHRGYCAGLPDKNQQEQQQLSEQVDALWNNVLSDDYCGNIQRVQSQYEHWQGIKHAPTDSFMRHCELIEKLLYELTVIADRCLLTAANGRFESQSIWHHLLTRPHHAEALARIRGLGNKAASQGHCAPATRVQLRYLLVQIKESPMEQGEQNQVEEFVTQEILTPRVITIEPKVYFERLTTAIDEQIEKTLIHLQQLN